MATIGSGGQAASADVIMPYANRSDGSHIQFMALISKSREGEPIMCDQQQNTWYVSTDNVHFYALSLNARAGCENLRIRHNQTYYHKEPTDVCCSSHTN